MDELAYIIPLVVLLLILIIVFVYFVWKKCGQKSTARDAEDNNLREVVICTPDHTLAVNESARAPDISLEEISTGLQIPTEDIRRRYLDWVSRKQSKNQPQNLFLAQDQPLDDDNDVRFGNDLTYNQVEQETLRVKARAIKKATLQSRARHDSRYNQVENFIEEVDVYKIEIESYGNTLKKYLKDRWTYMDLAKNLDSPNLKKKIYKTANDIGDQTVNLIINHFQEYPETKILDLHGFRVKEAKLIINEVLDSKESAEVSSGVFEIITGRGLHSSNGRAKIKPMVKRILAQRGLDFWDKPGNSGCIQVDI